MDNTRSWLAAQAEEDDRKEKKEKKETPDQESSWEAREPAPGMDADL